jgi:hypothetical protein
MVEESKVASNAAQAKRLIDSAPALEKGWTVNGPPATTP